MSSKNWVIHTISPVFVPKDKESPHNTGPGISIILVIQHSFVHTRNSIILHSFRFNTPDKKKHTPIDIQGVSLQPAAIHHSPLLWIWIQCCICDYLPQESYRGYSSRRREALTWPRDPSGALASTSVKSQINEGNRTRVYLLFIGQQNVSGKTVCQIGFWEKKITHRRS